MGGRREPLPLSCTHWELSLRTGGWKQNRNAAAKLISPVMGVKGSRERIAL
jgi:hypothetical protein